MSNELEIDNGLVVTGGITGSSFYGDGSTLTGIVTDFTSITTDISGNGDLTVVGNVSASAFYGDGSNLQGIGVDLTNVTTNISGNGDLTVVGNVSASSFYGDGSNLTGVATDFTSITTDISGNGDLTVVGNVSASSFYGDGSNLAGIVTDFTSITTDISGNGDLTVVGNISASSLYSDGSKVISKDNLTQDFDVVNISGGETLYNGSNEYTQTTSGSLRISGTQTWCAEFKRPSSSGNNDSIISNRNGATGILIQIQTNGTIRGLAYGSTYAETFSSSVPIDEWVKVVFVVDSTQARLYVNDVEVDSDTLAGYSTSSGNFRIGNDVNSNYFLGSIRNVEIYSGAASNPTNWIPNSTSSLTGTTLVLQSINGSGLDNQQGLSFTTAGTPEVTNIRTTEVELNLDTLDKPISTTQDISASAFYGDGSNLTGVASDLENVTTDINTTQNITATGNISGAEFHGSGQYITGVVKGYVDNTVGDNSTNPITITHNLGTKDVMVVIRDNGTDKLGMASITATTTNAISVEFSVTPTTNQYSITIFALV